METRQFPFEVSASALLPAPLKRLARPLDPALLKLFVPEELVRTYSASRNDGQTAADFARGMLRQLDIDYAAPVSEFSRIPATGPVLIVANHPFGFLEGLILVDLLEKIRPDFRIVANGILSSTPALRQKVFFVNPFDSASAGENARSVRASLAWLRGGGALVMFPAGEVSHLNFRGEWLVADPEWNPAAARLACKTGCPTVPLFFHGANSIPFQMIGAIHHTLRTLNLAHELMKKRSHTISLRIGTAIPAAVLKNCGDAAAATSYLRARTYLLSKTAAPKRFALKFPKRAGKPVVDESPAAAIVREMEQLPSERTLAENSEFKVVLANAVEIPDLLRQIGRCRELTYRAVGEGTGNAIDLDSFDRYYQHLVLWHKPDRRLAGAYRLAATPDVLPKYGVRGLYTSTLFHYSPEFFERTGPAIELGRSFIALEYQKMYAPLLLLWKAIAGYVQKRPECAALFGAVSISGEYQAHSRRLMIDYLRGHLAQDLIPYVRARRSYHRRPLVPRPVKALARFIRSMDELSASVQDLELDGKGVPVLIRQYMKMGGHFLGFNVDQRFSNALDALVLADLRTATAPMLERLMGREGASAFRAQHSNGRVTVQ